MSTDIISKGYSEKGSFRGSLECKYCGSKFNFKEEELFYAIIHRDDGKFEEGCYLHCKACDHRIPVSIAKDIVRDRIIDNDSRFIFHGIGVTLYPSELFYKMGNRIYFPCKKCTNCYFVPGDKVKEILNFESIPEKSSSSCVIQ